MTAASFDWRLITVRPPWSFAIAHLGKSVENRSRSTSYRGPVAIHAGRRLDRHGANSPTLVHAAWFGTRGRRPVGVLAGADDLMQYGHVVAFADLVDCHPDDGACCAPWGQRSHTPPCTGLTVIHHLVLADVVPLATPIPARGQLGLPWRPDASLNAALNASPEAAERWQRSVANDRDEDGFLHDEPRCRDCACPMALHNAPEYGGGCEVCGVDCEGWR